MFCQKVVLLTLLAFLATATPVTSALLSSNEQTVVTAQMPDPPPPPIECGWFWICEDTSGS